MNWRRGKMKKKRSHQEEVKGAIIELLTVSSVCVCACCSGTAGDRPDTDKGTGIPKRLASAVAVARTPFKAFYKFCKLTQIESIIWAKCRQRLNWKKI